jgi:hypothetical protein
LPRDGFKTDCTIFRRPIRPIKTNAKIIGFELPKGSGTPFAEKGLPLIRAG